MNEHTPKNRLLKSPTGVSGLDEVTGGGLPQGRTTLICGDAGCGKTLLGMEFLVRGAIEFGEPGVFMAFEETARELAVNVASLGFDLDELVARKQLVIDYVHIERSEIEETGEYDLNGLFIRLGHAIDTIGAKRVVLDTVEALFTGLPNPTILRAELRRLFRWLKDKGVTAIVTGERGEVTLTREGLEEYVSDCVIVLEHRVREQVSSRLLRVVKYRGSTHGTNEYPFLIDESGISVLPITSIRLQHDVLSTRISTGVPRLDSMFGGAGYYVGSSCLISGSAGTGKSSFAAHFADAACQRGERILYFAFEESPGQIIRNMRAIGVDLARHVEQGLLQFRANRPSYYGLEMHLATMHKAINAFEPQAVILDPINSFVVGNNSVEVKSMLMRLIDFLKSKQITTLLTSLTAGGEDLERTDTAISSLIDTWLLLVDIESSGERNRGLYILKSRGMAHSNQIREFLITDRGIELSDVYIGPAGVLTGSARMAQEAQEQAERTARFREIERLRLGLEHKRKAMEAQIATLQAEFATQEAEALAIIEEEEALKTQEVLDQSAMAANRQADH